MRLPVLILVLMMTGGCSSQLFSASALSRVDATLSMVRENPQGMRGSYVMVGGVIADLKNQEQSGELEVEELPLDSYGKPKSSSIGSHGKFLLASRDVLDPQVYRKGLPVSVIGEVVGAKTLSAGEKETTYPLLAIRELRLWTGK